MVVMLMPFVALADGGVKGGEEFRKTAIEYERKAIKAELSNKHQEAGIYLRQAEIKRAAAKLADQGKWSEIDWSEYESLNEKLAANMKATHFY